MKKKCRIQFFSAFMGLLTALSVSSGVAFAAPPASDLVTDEMESAKAIISSKSASSKISVSKLESVAEDYNVPDEFLEAVSNKKSITINQLKQYAQKYTLPAQYVQRFVQDAFVFKKGNTLEYIAVDDSLPKNNYDWDNLVHSSKEIKYQVNGKNKALKGIDVSEFQGNINWKQVKADGVKYAFIRMGYRGYSSGKLVMDKYFRQNMENATAAGVKVGVYFYSQAISTEEAIQEAKVVLKYIKDYDITYPVVFDLEDAASTARTRNLTPSQATKIANAFLSTVKKAGYRPMLYTNATWATQKLDMTQLKNYDVWLAQYYHVPFYPYKFQIWQYTGQGRVKGINGNVDMNLCFTDYSKSKIKA